jgi:hypothetical protein
MVTAGFALNMHSSWVYLTKLGFDNTFPWFVIELYCWFALMLNMLDDFRSFFVRLPTISGLDTVNLIKLGFSV